VQQNNKGNARWNGYLLIIYRLEFMLFLWEMQCFSEGKTMYGFTYFSKFYKCFAEESYLIKL